MKRANPARTDRSRVPVGKASVEWVIGRAVLYVRALNARNANTDKTRDCRAASRLPVPRVSDSWVVKLGDEIRTELLDLGCREVPFVFTPVGGKARSLQA